MDPITELLNIYWDELSPKLQAYIKDQTWLNQLKQLKDRHELNDEQYQPVLTETTLALFGLSDYQALGANLRVELPAELADPVVKDIQSIILAPIADELETRHRANQQVDEITEKLNQLPAELKQVIESETTLDNIRLIGSKHKLHVDQLGQLADETMKVMTGLTRPYNYINRLEQELEINYDLANQIAKDINEQVFNPVREQLKQVHHIGPVTDKESADTPADLEAKARAIEKTLDEKTTETAPKAESPAQPELTADQSTRDLFKDKLAGLYKNSSAKKEDSDQAETKSKYTDGDPYREPIE